MSASTLVDYLLSFLKLETQSGCVRLYCSMAFCFLLGTLDTGSGIFFFVRMTAFVLFPLWTAMIVYGYKHQQRVRRTKVYSEREHLFDEFWKYFILHVSIEATGIAVILVLFYYTQKINFAEICIMITLVMTDRDARHWDKSIPHIFFFVGMVFIFFLCIGTLCQAMCNKENFITELRVLNATENEAGKESLEILIPNHSIK